MTFLLGIESPPLECHEPWWYCKISAILSCVTISEVGRKSLYRTEHLGHLCSIFWSLRDTYTKCGTMDHYKVISFSAPVLRSKRSYRIMFCCYCHLLSFSMNIQARVWTDLHDIGRSKQVQIFRAIQSAEFARVNVCRADGFKTIQTTVLNGLKAIQIMAFNGFKAI